VKITTVVTIMDENGFQSPGASCCWEEPFRSCLQPCTGVLKRGFNPVALAPRGITDHPGGGRDPLSPGRGYSPLQAPPRRVGFPPPACHPQLPQAIELGHPPAARLFYKLGGRCSTGCFSQGRHWSPAAFGFGTRASQAPGGPLQRKQGSTGQGSDRLALQLPRCHLQQGRSAAMGVEHSNRLKAGWPPDPHNGHHLGDEQFSAGRLQ